MKTISLFLSLILFVQLALGQKAVANPMAKKNTITISYSPASLEHWTKGFQGMFRPHPKPTIIEGDYGFAAVGYNNSKFTGVFLLSYSHRLAPMFELTLDLGYEQEWKDWKIYNNPLRITDKVERAHYLYSLLYGSVVYVSKSKVEMYSSLGIGATTIWDNVSSIDARIESNNKTKLIYQICIFGIRAKCADWWGLNGSVEVGHVGFLRLGAFVRW
jgi:hypothetical protein